MVTLTSSLRHTLSTNSGSKTNFATIKLMDTGIRLARVAVALGGTKVLKGVTADMPGGKIYGLLGPSGAGKTTLMRVIIGRQHIDGGTATVLGLNAGSKVLRTQIGYMPQAQALYPDLTVRENIRYFAAMRGVRRRMADEILHEVELEEYAGQIAATLSGGQRSRVSLAIALIGHPKLLVLDEPTVGVDPVLRQKLWKIFRRVAADGTTLLISSHVMDEAARCDELLLIRRGKLLAQGTPGGLCAQTSTGTVEEAFLALTGAKG